MIYQADINDAAEDYAREYRPTYPGGNKAFAEFVSKDAFIAGVKWAMEEVGHIVMEESPR